jgi:transposase
VLENTGGYEAELIIYLQSKGLNVHRADNVKVKNFIRSTGKLGKSDSIDAEGIARYAKERHMELGLHIQMDANSKKLLEASSRRDELKQSLVQEKNRLKSPENKSMKESNEAFINFLELEIAKIEKIQYRLISLDVKLKAKVELLVAEISGVGEITAIGLLSKLPELGTMNRRQVASLAGVAPHPNESGQKIGYRCTRGGREDVKRLLFMAAMSAARSKSILGEFYKRLIAAGKKPMVAITALMRKIVVIANAKIKSMAIA